MTNEERDKLIRETHEAVIMMKGRVEDHHITLFGNGKSGLKEDMAVAKTNYKNCPARLAASNEGKRLTVAYAMMVIAIISLIVTVLTTFK
jgi:hypothetical protein